MGKGEPGETVCSALAHRRLSFPPRRSNTKACQSVVRGDLLDLI
jgi:hypothetical protein